MCVCYAGSQVWCMSGAGVICTKCYFERWYGTELGCCGVWVLR